ncbi:MAG: histidine phosphatase family protein [Pseudomonadota bacterium]
MGLFDYWRRLPGGALRLRSPLYFVRHGQTDWNAEQRLQGLSDIPLNETGRAQAARNGRVLGSLIRERGTVQFVTSPLSRAVETLEIIRREMELPIKRYALDDRLVEIDLGEWNGKTRAEIEADDPGVFDRQAKARWRFEIPGGEPYADAAGRARDFLTSLRGPTIVVAHGGIGRLIRGYALGLPMRKLEALRIPHDQVFALRSGGEKVY